MTQDQASKYKGGIHVHLKAAKRGSMTICEVQFYQDKVAPYKLHQSWSIICVTAQYYCLECANKITFFPTALILILENLYRLP